MELVHWLYFIGETRISLLKKLIEDQLGENLAITRDNRSAHNILMRKSKGKNHL